MKKGFIILLAMLMVMAMVPAVALAVDTTLTVGPGEAYTTIQSAVDAVGTGTTEIIVKAGTYSENVTITQKADTSIVITGQTGAVFTGNMDIFGASRNTGAETITINNMVFDKSGQPGHTDRFIIDLFQYAHNLTVSGCSFIGEATGDWTFGIQAGSSGGNRAYNVTVRDTTFLRADCAVQARCTGLSLENVSVSGGQCGINGLNSVNISLKNVTIIAAKTEFAIRLGENSGLADPGTLTIEDSALSCVGGNALLFRASSRTSVTISSSDIMGNVLNQSANAMSLTADDVYWSKGSSITGFSDAQMNITNNAEVPHSLVDTGETEVTAGVDPSYTIVIPSTVNLGTLQKGVDAAPQSFDVTAQNVVIEEGKSIVVFVSSDYLLSSGSATLAYVLYSGTNTVTAASNTFATFTGNATQGGSVQVPSTNGITTAGRYTDTMTFRIAYQ